MACKLWWRWAGLKVAAQGRLYAGIAASLATTCCLQNGLINQILANGFSIPLAGLPLECLLDCCTVVTTANGEPDRLLCALPAGCPAMA